MNAKVAMALPQTLMAAFPVLNQKQDSALSAKKGIIWIEVHRVINFMELVYRKLKQVVLELSTLQQDRPLQEMEAHSTPSPTSSSPSSPSSPLQLTSNPTKLPSLSKRAPTTSCLTTSKTGPSCSSSTLTP